MFVVVRLLLGTVFVSRPGQMGWLKTAGSGSSRDGRVFSGKGVLSPRPDNHQVGLGSERGDQVVPPTADPKSFMASGRLFYCQEGGRDAIQCSVSCSIPHS